MKNIVVSDEYNEKDIKPSDLLRHYIDLTKEDVAGIFVKGRLVEKPCPACASKEVASKFSKYGLQYNECKECRSLYISPRPDDKLISSYYTAAPSRVFWREQLSRKTQLKRKEKIIKPRFQWMLDSAAEFCPRAEHYADVNTDQYGYVEEILQTDAFNRKTLINPFFNPLKEENNKTLEIVSNPWWEADLKNSFDIVSLFEVTDHTSDVDLLFEKVRGMLKPKGLCFMTTILSSGFDIQVLWDKAENIYPPDRLNVFSAEGLKQLLERHNFECLEFSTPGILDAELVLKALKENPALPIPRFARYLLQNRDEDIKIAFQEFLQSSLLSSYGRILLRKR